MNVPTMSEPGAFAQADSLADKIHAANTYADGLECYIYEELFKIFGADEKKPETWPCGDVSFDWYDNSIELSSCKPDLEFKPEHRDAILAMGFSRGWLNWDSEQELYFTKEYIGEKRMKTK